MFLISKRGGLVVLTAVLVGSLGAGTVWSYIRTAGFAIRNAAEKAIPAEFELERLRMAIDQLQDEIRQNQEVAKRLDVEIEFDEEEIGRMQGALARAKEEMTPLRKALGEQRETCEFGGKPFTKAEVEEDLEQRLHEYDNMAVRLTARRRIVEERREILATASDKIRQQHRELYELKARAESLQGRLALARMAEQTGNFEIDDSRLNEAKTIAEKAARKVRVRKELADGHGRVGERIPVVADHRSVSERFDETFAESRAEGCAATESRD